MVQPEPELVPLITSEQISQRVQTLAEQISRDFQGRDLVLVGVLKGAFIFMADLARNLNIPAEMDFVRVASYGQDTRSSGQIRLTKDLETRITGRDLVVVEDIVDSGLTMAWLLEHFQKQTPRSVSVCALIDKTERRESEVQVDYRAFDVAEGFLVGYGLDCNEQYRGLPGIFTLKFQSAG